MGRPRTCECGICHKCKWREYMRGWYARNASTARESARRSRQRRVETVRAYDRARGHRIYDPQAEKARALTYRAIKRGDLVRQPCEKCGSEKAEAHHPDYAEPLNVSWLCRTHHMELHRVFA